MGHKVNPIGLRVGYIKTWQSRWFATKKDFCNYIKEDFLIRGHIKKSLQNAAVSKIEIERAGTRIRIIVFTARPGVIIGRRGSDVERLREELQRMTKKEVFIDIHEIKNPGADAQLVSENVAFQLEKRIAFRRAMKKAIQVATNSGAQGIKIICSGRLGGAEMSRTEKYMEGKVPLHTFRADIDYGFSEARTKYGAIGVKTWIYHGDVIVKKGRGASHGVNAEQSQI